MDDIFTSFFAALAVCSGRWTSVPILTLFRPFASFFPGLPSMLCFTQLPINLDLLFSPCVPKSYILVSSDPSSFLYMFLVIPTWNKHETRLIRVYFFQPCLKFLHKTECNTHKCIWQRQFFARFYLVAWRVPFSSHFLDFYSWKEKWNLEFFTFHFTVMHSFVAQTHQIWIKYIEVCDVYVTKCFKGVLMLLKSTVNRLGKKNLVDF